MCVCVHVALTQAPAPQVEVITGAEVDQKASVQSVKARSDVHKRAVKGSSRRPQKTPQPPAGAVAENKEVRRATFDVFNHFMIHYEFFEPRAGC